MKIILRGIEVDVDFHYQCEEPSTFDSPGCGEAFEDLCVYHKGVDISDLLDLDEMYEEIISLIKDQYE